MTTGWTDDERDLGYTRLCEVLTEAGPDGELAFLARLSLLLGEALGNAAAFSKAIDDARVADRAAHTG